MSETNYKLYVNKAVELGQTAICFTEHGNTYNNIEKIIYANSKGLKYLHGVEIYLTESLDVKVRDNYHMILIAKNFEGVKEINLLIDKSTREDICIYKPRITFDEFFAISNNIIKISTCLVSPLSRYPNNMFKSIEKRISELKEEWEKELSLLNQRTKDKDKEGAWIHSFDNADYDHAVP